MQSNLCFLLPIEGLWRAVGVRWEHPHVPPPLFPPTPQVPPDFGRKVWLQWVSHFPPFHPYSFPSNPPTNTHFFFLQWSQFCCVHSKTCWFLHGYLLFLIFAISFFGSIADLVPQVLLLALLHLDPKKIPGVPIQVSNQSGHSSQHYLQIYWFLT